MELKEIIDIQRIFDKSHNKNFNWAEDISEENLQGLQFLTLSLAGEVGELANCVKKIIRGDEQFDSSKTKISEELTDVFIYTVKIAYQMNINLEESYLRKLEINKTRFKSFEEDV